MKIADGFLTMANREKVTATLIVAFAILYDYYLVSGLNGWFLDVFARKAYIYISTMIYCCSLIYMGNSNNKSKLEMSYRKIATGFFALFCLGVILNNLKLLSDPIYYCILFCSITIILVFFFIFKADKEGNI